MLKLTSNKGGKFDIVFEHSPDLDNSAKQSGNRATSAGRRKTKEWKSKVLPKKVQKEPQLKNVKTSKATQLRKSTIAKKYDRKKKDEKSKPEVKPDDSIPNEADTNNEVSKQQDANQIEQKDPSAKKQIERRSTYTFEENSGAAIISSEVLNQIQEELKENETDVEPRQVPGLQIVTSPKNSNEPLNKPISPISTLSTSRREEELRKHQSTPIQIYDPWGKPGAGAPVNNSDGGVRTHRNVKMLQAEKDGMNQTHSTTKSPREEESTPEYNSANSIGKPSLHARGKGKQPHEMSDQEKRKAKHYEHQQAIAAQVEEKRRQKQLEKENKLKEEREEEERYQKQQELIRKRLEEEQKKEKEKQEAKLRKQMLLEENMLKAQEEAKKAKDEARKARMQRAQSPEQNSKASPQFKRVLHSENDTIRSSQSYVDNKVLEEFANLYNEKPSRVKSPPTKNNYSSPAQETYQKPPQNENLTRTQSQENNDFRPTTEDNQSDVMDDYLVPFHRTKTAEMYESYDESLDESRNGSAKNDLVVDKKQKTKSKKLKVQKSLQENNDVNEEYNDRPLNIKKTKKSKQKTPPPPVIKSSRPTSWIQNQNDVRASVASPSTKRQQEILNRLAELRAGLKQKERDCYETTWSR